MGLLGLLVVILIALLLLIFGGSTLSPFNINPENPQNIKSKAQQVIDQSAERTKMEQDQLRNLESN